MTPAVYVIDASPMRPSPKMDIPDAYANLLRDWLHMRHGNPNPRLKAPPTGWSLVAPTYLFWLPFERARKVAEEIRRNRGAEGGNGHWGPYSPASVYGMTVLVDGAVTRIL
jgi:hypothetical protein